MDRCVTRDKVYIVYEVLVSYHFSFGEDEGLDPVADVLEHQVVHVLEQRHLSDEVEAERSEERRVGKECLL